MMNRITTFALALVSTTLLSTMPATAGSIQNAGVLVMSPNAQGALTISGQAKMQTSMLRVNSNHTKSITLSGYAILDTADAATVGGVYASGSARCTSTIITGTASTTDPWASMAPPSFDPANDLGTRSISGGTTYVQPGYYSGGIIVSAANVTLLPGIYILGGHGLTISNGSSRVAAEGVMLYLRGSTSTLTISGGAGLSMSPPSSGPYAGISLFQDRADTTKVSVSGGSNISIAGVMYMTAALLEVSGSSQTQSDGPSVGGVVIAKTITVSGSGLIKLGYRAVMPVAQAAFD